MEIFAHTLNNKVFCTIPCTSESHIRNPGLTQYTITSLGLKPF